MCHHFCTWKHEPHTYYRKIRNVIRKMRKRKKCMIDSLHCFAESLYGITSFFEKTVKPILYHTSETIKDKIQKQRNSRRCVRRPKGMLVETLFAIRNGRFVLKTFTSTGSFDKNKRNWNSPDAIRDAKDHLSRLLLCLKCSAEFHSDVCLIARRRRHCWSCILLDTTDCSDGTFCPFGRTLPPHG